MMTTKRKMQYFLIILWLLLCLYLSVQPMTETGKLSMGISSWIAQWIHIPAVDCDFYLRKAAHGGIFLILSLLCSSVSSSKKTLMFCLGIATAIEILKIPVKDRHTELLEVLLDYLGIIIGFAIIKLGSRFAEKKKVKK